MVIPGSPVVEAEFPAVLVNQGRQDIKSWHYGQPFIAAYPRFGDIAAEGD